MRLQHEAHDAASPARPGPGTLASDADRDTTAGLLSEAFAEGRLTADEHRERTRAVYTARTWAELTRLTADLPVPADASAARPAVMPGGLDKCLKCALLILCPPVGIALLLAARLLPRPVPTA